MLLSVCILTKNEELSIKNCLDSVKKIADEIIILDSFSVDKTIEIAKTYTDKIYTHSWINDFSYSRNLCISKANGKWILIIDCDETFLYNETFILSLKTTNYDAFVLIRKECYRLNINNKNVCFPVGIIRLFKNNGKIKFHNTIHERLDDCFLDSKNLVGIANNCFLVHNINSKDKVKTNSKQKYYLELINNELELNNKNYWLIFQRAKTNFYFKNYDEAKTDLLLLIESKKVDSKLRLASFAIMSLILSTTDNHLASINTLKNGLKQNKETLFYCLLGDEYFTQRKYFYALCNYLKIKTNTNNLNYSNCMYLISYIEKSDKIYKICSTLYSIGFLKITKYILLYFKNNLGADSYYLLSLIYLRQNKLKYSKYYIRKSLELDDGWITTKHFYSKLLNL